ncbi:unnamed protein product [Rhizophagus irregularis]|nr:unnamed protein product [Rhizophagus irregularis]
MSILNLGLQGVAFLRNQMKSELRNSIKSIQQRLVLDNENFICKSPVDDEEIARFFEAIISIDSTLHCDETTQSILRQHSDLQNFIQTHCQIQTY